MLAPFLVEVPIPRLVRSLSKSFRNVPVKLGVTMSRPTSCQRRDARPSSDRHSQGAILSNSSSRRNC